jgi:prepilin-type N-terminal cleavage/methylation domain-containing protein
MRDKTGRKHAFTLIELLIVVAIGGIFAATQFVLMIEGVRRHDGVTKKAAVQGEARNVLETFARDARAAVDLPNSVKGISTDSEDVLLISADGEGERTVVVYSLAPGDRMRAGKEGPEVFLQQQVLTRIEWRPGEQPEEIGRKVISRVVDRFECEVRRGTENPLVVCAVSTADVSDGKRVICHLASLFTPRVDAADKGEKEAGE